MYKKIILIAACFCINAEAFASDRVQLTLDSRTSQQDGLLAESLMNSFFLAEVGPRIEPNETGTMETTFIGIDQVRCIYEGLVEADGHPSKTLLNTNYVCVENDSRSPDNKLSPGASFHIMKAVEEVVKAKSALVGAASFFVEDISCKGIWNAFPLDQGGTRDYICEFDVTVNYESE